MESADKDVTLIDNSITGAEKIAVYNRVSLFWAAHLPSAELVLVHWLLANTIGRGHRSGCYSYRQFVEGVLKADGSGRWCGGTGLSDRSVRRGLASLREKGVLFVAPQRRGTGQSTRYAINLAWHPGDLEPAPAERSADDDQQVIAWITPAVRQDAGVGVDRGNEDMLRLAKKGIQTPNKGLRGVVILAERGGQSDHSSKGIRNQRVDNLPSPVPGSASVRPVTNAEAITGAVSKRRKLLPNRPQDYQQTWNEAWKEASLHRVAPAFTRKTGGMMRQALKNWPDRIGSRHEFIRWSVLNWGPVIRDRFAWMTKSPPPTTPEPEFFARLVKHFVAAWCDAETIKWVGSLEGTAREVAEFQAKGYSREAAILEVAKLQALREDRQTRERDLQAAARLVNLAKVIQANARQTVTYDASNPHPRAAENRSLSVKVTDDGDGSFQPASLPTFEFDAG